MEGKKLTRIDFDNSENHSPYSTREVVTAVPSYGLNAITALSVWIKKNFKDIKYYVGYDGELYPKFKIETVEVIEPEIELVETIVEIKD